MERTIIMRSTQQKPAACDPRLGHALRKIREAVPMSGDQAARNTGWSPSKISRIESARIPVLLTDLEVLLDIYRVGETDRVQLLHAARSAGAGRGLDPILRASTMRDWSPLAIPEPLRSPAYARAVLESIQPITNTPPSQLDAAGQLVASMQNRLVAGTPPLQLHAVIGEAALGNGFGTPASMRSQIELLIQLAGLPNVDLSIARLGPGEGPRALGAFSVLSFDPVLGFTAPDKVLLPGLPRPIQMDDECETWPLRVAFGLLQEAADPDVVTILKKHYAKWGT
jgi:transcriptional regulator with XRE-family HTH domain